MIGTRVTNLMLGIGLAFAMAHAGAAWGWFVPVIALSALELGNLGAELVSEFHAGALDAQREEIARELDPPRGG